MNKIVLIRMLLLFVFLLLTNCNKVEVEKKETPPITPKWALGHIVWEDSINTQTAATDLIKQYKEHNIPVDGIIIDSPWSLSYNDFNWNKERYPNPNKMIANFKKQNVKVILWLTGCINSTARDVPVQLSSNFNYAKEHNYVINNGKESKWWKGLGMHLDFTNKNAVKWWNKELDKVFVDGVYGWKVDQGEAVFGDTVVTSLGKMSIREFKKYYYNSMYDYATSKRNGEGIILARPFSHQANLDGFCATVPKMSLGWCGDFSGDWSGLKLQIDNIYKSAKANYGALGCEIAGFQNKRSTKEQFIRYAQFASMVGGMVNGGANGAFTNHLPWYHDEETTNIYRYYVTLHHELSGYKFSELVNAHLNGGSLLKDVSFTEESHKVGNDIFFKAITSDSAKVAFSLPKTDEWIDFWSGEKYNGGSKIAKEYSLEKAPIFIRSGAIIPLEISNSVTGIGDETFDGKITLLIYPNGKSKYLYHQPLGDGIRYSDIEISYNDGEISVKSGKENSYIFLIKKEGTKDGFLKIEKDGKDFKMVVKN